MKKKAIKKAFTLVELLVVIAILAILGTVGIIGYTSFINKAHVSNDNSFITQLNLYAKASSVDIEGEDYKYPAQVDAQLNQFNFNDVSFQPTSKGYHYGFNIEKDEFVLIKDEGQGDLNTFAFVKSTEDATKMMGIGYSLYLQGKASDYADFPEVNVGVDTGEVVLPELQYVNNGSAQNVVIRTNGGSLTINDTNNASHQYHYGSSTNVTVTTGTACYECHAIVAAMKITAGKAIADEGAYVGVVEASATVTLAEENGGIFVIPTNVAANKIPAAVATQIGYTDDGETITASVEKAEKSYYVITDYADLTNFVDKWNSGLMPASANVKFADNVTIDLGETEAWTPIGNWEYPFNGTFDGNGCVITGLKADATHQNYVYVFAENASVGDGETYGFFGIVGGGDTVIKNLTLDGVNINLSSANNVGALVGYVPSNAKFKSTSSTDKWKNDTVIGTHKVTVSGVTVSGTVSANAHVSGLIGKIYSTGDITITDCHNKANVTGKDGFIGGIVGIQSGYDSQDNANEYKLTISGCTNEGNISLNGNQNSACGIIGRVNDQYSKRCIAVITNSSNTGTIQANQENRKHDIANVENVKSATVNGVKIK